MNKEIIKAMNRKEKKVSSLRKWWNKNGYKVMRVVLFPIWWSYCLKEKISSYLYSREAWSEERADEVLSYYIPRKAEWDESKQEFYFFDNGLGWEMKYHRKKIKRRDRRWWRIYAYGWGGKVRTYLIDKFELEGFEKEVINTYDSCTEIIFKLK